MGQTLPLQPGCRLRPLHQGQEIGREECRRVFESAKQRLVTKTDVIALLLTVFFDLSRIASLGAIFYLIMDVAVL
jgi:hypothetical protein